MIKYIFIDGYNVINAWNDLKELKDENLEEARLKLIEMIHDYAAFKGINVIVVFDAHFVKGSFEKHEMHKNVEVVYTKELESADCYIERNVAILSKKGEVAVVSSDYLEQRIVLQMGGIRITPKEFLIEIQNIKKVIKERTEISYVEKSNRLENNIKKDVLEKLEKMRRNL
ncbi:hypothetical protein SAMN05443428_1204 [Caloramator quimbayensis]|uniref:YacP-like NYN domain-containing protein n=1 Tax=Caloramator quimbayensis TaxID=1147123 RepID=A0A1T4Y2E3_9CLOT|nr:NYN domain-containing protein [Caloramator quimbayensis]SKA96007.1 hypothetical protein SAMN05443428_1204 [Caloramator quimbayensis]